MLTMKTSFVFLSIALAAATPVFDPSQQKPLHEVEATPITKPTNTTSPQPTHPTAIPTFIPFVIETMSNAHFKLHHKFTKAFLGERSYLMLRRAEIDQRTSDIDEFVYGQDWNCPGWPIDASVLSWEKVVHLPDGRMFDMDPLRVPEDVRAGLTNISDSAYETVRSWGCFANWDQNKGDERFQIPEEYLQYEVLPEAMEEFWKESDRKYLACREKQDRKILRGEWSVRDIVVPDLWKCTKIETVS